MPTLLGSHRTPDGLCSLNMASTNARWKYERVCTNTEASNSPKARNEGTFGRLQNYSHCSYGNRIRLATTMDSSSDESPPSSHMDAITLTQTSDSNMASERTKNKNSYNPTSIKPGERTAAIPTHDGKHRIN